MLISAGSETGTPVLLLCTVGLTSGALSAHLRRRDGHDGHLFGASEGLLAAARPPSNDGPLHAAQGALIPWAQVFSRLLFGNLEARSFTWEEGGCDQSEPLIGGQACHRTEAVLGDTRGGAL